jgi:transposase-like protein
MSYRPSLPPEITQHAIWLYCRFTRRYRNIEDLLAVRGPDISYETVAGASASPRPLTPEECANYLANASYAPA